MMAMMRSALLHRSAAVRLPAPAGHCHLSTGQGLDKLTKTLKFIASIFARQDPAQRAATVLSFAGLVFLMDKNAKSSAYVAELKANYAAQKGKK